MLVGLVCEEPQGVTQRSRRVFGGEDGVDLVVRVAQPAAVFIFGGVEVVAPTRTSARA